MAIVKMEFVSASTDQEHLDQMLLTGMKSHLLNAEPASEIVNDDNHGKLIQTQNVYSGYLQTLKNFGRSVGYEYDSSAPAEKAYTQQEIEDFLKELDEKFQITADSAAVTLSKEDEKALDALSECGFEKMKACRYLNFGLGRLPKDSFKKLAMYRDDIFVFHKLNENTQYIWMVYVTSDTYAEHIAKIFESLYFEPIEIPSVDIHRLLAEYKDRLQDVYAFCHLHTELYSMYPYIAIIDEKQILSGFVKADDLDSYKQTFAGQPVEFSVHEPAEVPALKPPTLLKNNWFARPFELFVEMYGLPAYDDMDPTMFLAITYCLLFGIMFGDLGQGLVLLLLGLIFEKKGKLWGIIGRVGITSMIFGFLFGSVFGYESMLNPIHQSLFHVREKLFDVMANSSTMIILIGAILIGAVLILTTMIMNIYNNARHKKWGEVWLSQNGVAGFIMYGFLLIALVKMLVFSDGSLLTPVWLILFMGIPAILFLLKEPLTNLISGHGFTVEGTGGFGGFIAQSFFEVFEIFLSFVTNSMSYLRVGGFVLSHAGMMLVVMTLAEMTGGASIVVVIFGNLLVMVLEGLIVGIQTLRLEYYEMFSRYYAGGGKKFKELTASAVD